MEVKKVLLRLFFGLILIFIYCLVWLILNGLILGILIGLNLYEFSTTNIGGTPGTVGIICLYLSYKLTKIFYMNKKIQRFFGY